MSHSTANCLRSPEPTIRLGCLLLVATYVVCGAPAHAWLQVVGAGRTSDVLVLEDGEIVSAGVRSGASSRLSVARHLPTSGSTLWQYDLTSGGEGYRGGTFLSASSDGAILAAGFQQSRYGPFAGAVAKLSVIDGAPIWHFEPTEPMGFRAVASHPSSDVVVAGSLSLTQEELADHAMAVLRLDGSSGAEVWRFVLDGFQGGQGEDELHAVIVDPDGDVFVAGSHKANPTLGYADFVVIKISGADGQQIWRHIVPSTGAHGGIARSLQLGPDGDIFAAGHAVLTTLGWCDIVVVRLEGDTGSEVWRASYDTGNGCEGAWDFDLDDQQNVFVAGNPRGGLFSILKYDGLTGDLVWRRDLPNEPGICLGGGCAGSIAVRADGQGSVFATGNVARVGPKGTVVRLSASTGDVLWVRHPTVVGCDDGPEALELDAGGNVVVPLSAWELVDGICVWPQEPRYAVATFTGSSGKDYWPGCHDDLDNDGDGLIDHPGDPGCRLPMDTAENPQCDDGIDNDGDGLIDWDDPRCTPNWPYRENRGCGLGSELALLLSVLRRLRRRARRVLD